MGQTLEHGVYLPDEGERNCYNGLAANWQLLDGAVGTVAEHTTQIAGKAPAVHTHTKSDITDLFNSANTWSANNTFSNYITSKESAAISAGGYGKGIVFRDYQSNRLGYIQPCLTSDNAKRLVIGADSGDVAANSSLIPHVNNSYNLGTSTNKWKTLNGVAPGALSLPVTALNNTYDISGNITDLTGGNNAITAARTGWIFVKSDNATEISIANTTTGMGASDHSASATTLMVSIPVTSGETLNIIANCTSIDKAYLLPCQGNV